MKHINPYLAAEFEGHFPLSLPKMLSVSIQDITRPTDDYLLGKAIIPVTCTEINMLFVPSFNLKTLTLGLASPNVYIYEKGKHISKLLCGYRNPDSLRTPSY
jgi:hypothetical protein